MFECRICICHPSQLTSTHTAQVSKDRHTDCLSYLTCSSRLTAVRASFFCVFISASSSAWSFSLACCFFSISDRRFDAVEDELWDNVPSRAPNSLCPRLRSSNCPLLRRSEARSWGDSVWGEAAESRVPMLASCLKRRRLELSLANEDWRRLRLAGDVGVCSSVSGRMTAEATALEVHD